jgi:hypothetical protein
MKGEMEQHALAWAARGFRVFPLLPGTKDPRPGRSWLEDATTDAATISALWSIADWNIGVATDGLIVVDIDQKNGKDGTRSYLDLDLPWGTLIVKTPTGGRHVYFSGPDRQNSAGRLGSGLDVRGFHGYVVGAGSYIPGAGRYEVEVDLPVAVAPSRLVDLLDRPRERGSQPAADVVLDQDDAVVRARGYLESAAPLAIEGEGGDATTYRVACAVKDFGISEGLAHDLMLELWNDRCSPPWDADELRQKIDNAYFYGATPVGALSPQAEFKGVVIPPVPVPLVEAAESSRWFDHGDDWNVDQPWLIYKTLPQTGVALLTGPPQGGKTFLALELARCVATGKEFFTVAPDVIGGTVLLYAGTEGSGLSERLAALEEPKRLPISALVIGGLGAPDAMETLKAELRTKMADMQEKHGVPVRLLVLETLSASGLIKDENSNSEAAEAFVKLAALGRALGVLVLVTHHPGKNGSAERGASAIRGSADYMLEVRRDGDKTSVRDLELVKARNAPQRTLGSFTLVPVVLGHDSRGREVSSLCVSSGAPQTRTDRVANRGGEFMELMQIAEDDFGEVIEGKKVVPIEDAKEFYRERRQGSKDKSNSLKAWNEMLGWGENTGAVEQGLIHGRRYIWIKRF